MPTLMDLVSWFFLCILAVFTLGGFYIDHATKYPSDEQVAARRARWARLIRDHEQHTKETTQQ